MFCISTLVALQERRPGHTDGLSPHYSGSSRHCRAAPAHHAATQWFLLTFHFLPTCAGQIPFIFSSSPPHLAIWEALREPGQVSQETLGEKKAYIFHFLLPSFTSSSKPSRFIYIPTNSGINLVFCWLICNDGFLPQSL